MKLSLDFAGRIELTDEDRRAALLLGAARELTNRSAGLDTQNTPNENASGHALGALAEAAFAKRLDESSTDWVWTEPLRIEGGRATGGASGGDFSVRGLPDEREDMRRLEIKSVWLRKPYLNFNARKLAKAIDSGVVWLPVVLCPALSHAWATAPLRPIEALLGAVRPNRDRSREDWEWRRAAFHPDEFGQSYFRVSTASFLAKATEPLQLCPADSCDPAAESDWSGAAARAVEALRRTNPDAWPDTGIRELIDVRSYGTFLEWWRTCRLAARA